MTTLYGIHNCDSVKKAKKWLEQSDIDFSYHDFRKDAFDSALVDEFIANIDWQLLLNKRSTSWKALSDSDKEDLDENKARALILANPTLIKRPVLKHGADYQVGFKAAQYQATFGQ